jgi:hypothetical protein
MGTCHWSLLRGGTHIGRLWELAPEFLRLGM